MPNFDRARKYVMLLACLAAGACARGATDVALPSGDAAYALLDSAGPAPTQYVFVPEDKIDLRVFGEPDISNDELVVDRNGFIQVALAGEVKAIGRTSAEIKQDITSKLAARYLRDPQVTVALKEAAKRYVTVEGEVKMPGVYELDNNFTLLTAIARAQSTTPLARLNQVIVFRTIDGRRAAARFDLADIRGGAAPDPTIMPNDVVMVGYSKTLGTLENVLKAAPILNSFVYLSNNNNN